MPGCASADLTAPPLLYKVFSTSETVVLTVMLCCTCELLAYLTGRCGGSETSAAGLCSYTLCYADVRP
jgi:hypothetical protein